MQDEQHHQNNTIVIYQRVQAATHYLPTIRDKVVNRKIKIKIKD